MYLFSGNKYFPHCNKQKINLNIKNHIYQIFHRAFFDKNDDDDEDKTDALLDNKKMSKLTDTMTDYGSQ